MSYYPPQQPYYPQQQPQQHFELPSGKYLLRNKATGLTMDCNTSAAYQKCKKHPRVFANSVNDTAANHHWYIEKIQGNEYMICTAPSKYQPTKKALDGNINAPQHKSSHPAPFLWDPTPSASNHRWYFIPAPTGEPYTYVIVNASNGKALDGNIDGCDHYDTKHKTPFLWDRVDSAPNHQWILTPIYHEATMNQPVKSSNGGAVAVGVGVGLIVAGPLGAIVGGVIADAATKKK
jgi:hypothetical protein